MDRLISTQRAINVSQEYEERKRKGRKETDDFRLSVA